MMNPYKIYPFIMPPAYPDYNLPPTLYSILNSLVNYGSNEKTKIKNLASEGRSYIFDFEYPLSNKINKEEFEIMILNHFIMRRIGYETMTAFKLALSTKLNEVMPIYNKMFDMLDGWDLFNDGELVTENGNNKLNNSTNSKNISDRRYSDTPQNELQNVQDGKYGTDDGKVTSESIGSDSRTISRTPADKIKIYKEFIDNTKSIYTMIFDSLDPLFYGLI